MGHRLKLGVFHKFLCSPSTFSLSFMSQLFFCLFLEQKLEGFFSNKDGCVLSNHRCLNMIISLYSIYLIKIWTYLKDSKIMMHAIMSIFLGSDVEMSILISNFYWLSVRLHMVNNLGCSDKHFKPLLATMTSNGTSSKYFLSIKCSIS